MKAPVLLAAALAAGGAVRAQPAPAALEPVVVQGSRSADLVGAADSATEGRITAPRLATRPLLRAAEVLESVPGMTVTQHSGDGKANQYFLRGFNLDHGSDFATFVLGVPVNMVSHAHGQGYSDLNFLIPELVQDVRYRKGSYAAEDGDLAVTGAARIDYRRSLPAPFVDVTLGAHDHRRLLAAGSRPLDGGAQLLGAVELGRTDGPWEQPERLRRAQAVLRLSDGTAQDGYAATFMSYRSRWTATEQVPQRAIDSGEIGRYGTLAPTDGGVTYRHVLALEGAHSSAAGRTQAQAYLMAYGLNLFSTPSGLQQPQHEQEDRRRVTGGSLAQTLPPAAALRDSEITLGLQWRHDRVPRLGLFLTEARSRSETVRADRLGETALGLHAQARTAWLPWLRSTLGLRWDRVGGDVHSTGGAFNGANGGRAHATQLSPKLALAVGPFAGTEFYVNAGSGFHSNDLRGATAKVDPTDGAPADAVPVLARARSEEVGLRATPAPGWHTALSLWRTRLSSELVFIGDAGVTEPRGASRRSGIEWWNDVALNRWLSLDADLALSRARFTQAANGGTEVPNAVPLSASLGLSADGGGAWSGGLRLRRIGAYPLEETGTQKSAAVTTANLKLAWTAGPRLGWHIELLNLFDRRANDIEYWGSSCTRSEGAACNGGAGIDGRLVHPLEPRTLRASVRVGF